MTKSTKLKLKRMMKAALPTGKVQTSDPRRANTATGADIAIDALTETRNMELLKTLEQLRAEISHVEVPLKIACTSSDGRKIRTRSWALTYADMHTWPALLQLHAPASGVAGVIADSENIRNYFAVTLEALNGETRRSREENRGIQRSNRTEHANTGS